MLFDELRRQTVQHRQQQRADLEAVHVGIGAQDDLAPAQRVDVERRNGLVRLRLYLHAAAEHLNEIGDDLTFENLVVIRFQTVQNFTADRHHGLIVRVARLLDRTESGIALHDKNLTLGNILAAAVHKLRHAPRDIHFGRQLAL